MIREKILSNKSIAVKDFLLEAKEQEYPNIISIGYIEINGIIKSEDLELSVVF